MKYLISFILSFNVLAKALVKIHYEQGRAVDAHSVQLILQNKYDIPKSLIKLTQQECLKKQNVLQLCINKKRELQVLPLYNNEILNSLQVFNYPQKGSL